MNAPLRPLHSRLDDELARFLEHMTGGPAAPDSALPSLAEVRRGAEAVRRPLNEGGPVMAAVRERDVPAGSAAVRIRIFRPGGADGAPVLVYLHGGGWTLCSLDTHDRVMREYAARSGFVVVGVDYSLAPEFPYPLAVQQCADVVRWVRDHGRDEGLDPSSVAIGGDSAGANLALGTCLLLRDDGHPMPFAALLNYGCYDPALRSASHRRYGDAGLLLTAQKMRWFWGNYLGGARGPAPYAVPASDNLTGLPPCWVAVGELDVLHDENLVLADWLRAAGNAVRPVVYAGAPHAYLEAVGLSDLSRRALDEQIAWLIERLARRRGEADEEASAPCPS